MWPGGGQFLPQDVAFSIHLSDNRFTARPLATTVVSPPRKLAPWVDISWPQPASARFFAKCLLSACALYIPLLNNWELTDVNGRAVKWVRRTVVEPLLKIYLLTFRWLSPLACHVALSGPVKLWDPLMICQAMIPLTPGHRPTEIGHNQPNAGTISDRSPLGCVVFKTANRPDLARNLPVTLSRYPF